MASQSINFHLTEYQRVTDLLQRQRKTCLLLIDKSCIVDGKQKFATVVFLMISINI